VLPVRARVPALAQGLRRHQAGRQHRACRLHLYTISTPPPPHHTHTHTRAHSRVHLASSSS
jgi:hypothetical protein